jgi:hypothetical protein
MLGYVALASWAFACPAVTNIMAVTILIAAIEPTFLFCMFFVLR